MFAGPERKLLLPSNILWNSDAAKANFFDIFK